MNVRKGTYVLVIALGSDRDIRVGALGTVTGQGGVVTTKSTASDPQDESPIAEAH